MAKELPFSWVILRKTLERQNSGIFIGGVELILYPLVTGDIEFHLPTIGSAHYERIGGIQWAPHYFIFDHAQKQGFATELVKLMFKLARAENRSVIWCDSPYYNGAGTITAEGRAFAEAYRRKYQ